MSRAFEETKHFPMDHSLQGEQRGAPGLGRVSDTQQGDHVLRGRDTWVRVPASSLSCPLAVNLHQVQPLGFVFVSCE